MTERLAATLVLVLVLPTTADARRPKKDPWAALNAAVAQARVGDPAKSKAAIPALKRLTRRGPRLARAAAAHVLARVLAATGDVAQARAMLKRARPMRRISKPAWLWAELEVLLAEKDDAKAFEVLTTLRRKFPRFRQARADMMFSRLQERVAEPMATAATALHLYDRDDVNLPGDELLDRAARMFDGPSPQRAAKLWKQLVLDHPESPLADRALRRIAPLTQAEQLRRVDRLFQRRAYEACRAAAQPLWDADYERPTVGYYLGKLASERLRDDYKAAEVYLRAASAEGAPLALPAMSSLAITLQKLGRTDDAVKTFDRWLVRFADAPIRRRAEAWYDRGRALHVGGRSRQAAADLAGFLKENRRGFDVDKYRWFVGWWYFLAKDYEAAIRNMKPLLGDRNTIVGPKARYWIARSRQALGEKKEAVDAMARLARDLPLTYYGGLAMRWLETNGHKKRLPRLRRIPKPKGEADPFADLPSTPHLERLRAAVHLGEADVARRVLKVVRSRLEKSLTPEQFTQFETGLAGAFERESKVRGAAYSKHRRSLRRVPVKRTVDAWRAAYPRAFRAHAEAAATRFEVPPALVYAHMLAESRFAADAISRAPAYGLLQLIDRTARRLAQKSRSEYQLWMLMQPRFNIPLGVSYLGALIHKFHGQLPFAIGSYNGGPMLFERHLSRNRALPFDALVEDLSTHEARRYTKKVIEYSLRYAALYLTRDKARKLRQRLIPAKWTPKYRKHPDY